MTPTEAALKLLPSPNQSIGDLAEQTHFRAIAPESTYGEFCRLIERFARRIQEARKVQLDRERVPDLTSVQLSVLRLIADGAITPRLLVVRGAYLGAMLTYNLKSLVDRGYVTRSALAADGRSVELSLTDKGREMCALLDRLEANEFAAVRVVEAKLQRYMRLLRRLEDNVVAEIKLTKR